jgi:signal transduction histidine kinase
VSTRIDEDAGRPGLPGGITSVQEIAFSVCMGVVAVLSKGNPMLDFPEVLWAFAALLGFNLGYQILLRRRGEFWLVPMVSIAANAVLISLVLDTSGRWESYFWPMYLLPIFTACFYLELRHVVFAVFAAVAFMAVFYLDLAETGPYWEYLELVVKGAVLALSAAVTFRMASKERRVHGALDAARGDLDRLARRLTRAELPGVQSARRRGILLEELLYDLQSQLMSVLGSAEVLLEAAPPDAPSRRDLDRIRGSARSMRRLVADVIGLLRGEGKPSDLRLPEAGAQSLALVEFRLRQKSVALSQDAQGELPALHVDPVQLKHALLDLFAWAADRVEPEGVLRVSYRPCEGGQSMSAAFTHGGGSVLGDIAEYRESFSLLGGSLELRTDAGEAVLELSFGPKKTS